MHLHRRLMLPCKECLLAERGFFHPQYLRINHGTSAIQNRDRNCYAGMACTCCVYCAIPASYLWALRDRNSDRCTCLMFKDTCRKIIQQKFEAIFERLSIVLLETKNFSVCGLKQLVIICYVLVKTHLLLENTYTVNYSNKFS